MYNRSMPNRIQSLPKSVYELIAAGEVIQSPFSVVKELLENSIDAKSTSIKIGLQGGGKERIDIEDNGGGIRFDDLGVLATQHATSKISQPNDIYNIKSLGFRGEALFSLTRVSHLEIRSAVKGESGGSLTVLNGKRKVTQTPHTTGTSISVRKLFYNTPARLKQMQSAKSHLRQIRVLVERYAMVYPRIAFQLASDQKTVFDYPAVKTIDERFQQKYAQDLDDHLLYVNEKIGNASVEGFISTLDFGRNNRSEQHCFVNGRFVELKSFFHAASSAYSQFPLQFAQPIVFLIVKVKASDIDVNIHPNKKEIKLFKEEQFHEAVYRSVKNRLKQEYEKGQAVESQGAQQKEAVEKAVRAIQPSLSASVSEKKNTFNKKTDGGGATKRSFPSPLFSRTKSEIDYREDKTKPMVVEESEATYSIPRIDVDVLATLFETYQLICVDGEYWLLDQHAAAERVAYDRLRAQFEKGKVESQLLLFPLPIDYTADALTSFESKLADFGFELNEIGPNQMGLRAVPALVAKQSEKELVAMVLEVLETLHRKTVSPPKQLDRVLKSISCRYSIMAHDRLSEGEVTRLITDLLDSKESLTCPHGRPTYRVLDKKTIEKMFGRR
jgi:DNA mismatch repair protein MutL